MTYILYGDKRSGAFCVECALAEAGAAYEFNEVSLDRNEQRSTEYLTLNPSGKVPALGLPEGPVIPESLSLLLTIADRYPEANLLPPSRSVARAQCLRWLAFMASEIYPMIEIVDYPDRFAAEKPEMLKARAVSRARERMLVIEKVIAAPWFLSSGFSLADIYAVMFGRWIAADWREKNLPKIIAPHRDGSKASQDRAGLGKTFRVIEARAL